MPAAFVQSKSTSTGTATSTAISVTFASAVSSGNLVCGIVSWGTASSSNITSVTDDKSNTYTIQRTVLDSLNGQAAASFFAANVTNAPITVTANLSSAIAFRALSAHEASGLATVSPLDVETGQLTTARSTGTDGVATPSVTTVKNGDYIFGGVVDSGALRFNNFSAGSSYTEREQTGDVTGNLLDIESEDLIQATAGAIKATWTQANPDDAMTFLLSFKVPAATGSVVTPRHLTLLGVGS